MSLAISIVNSSTIVTFLKAESLYSFSNTYNISFGEIADTFKKDFKAFK
jgi:hypothetical protein